MPRSHASRTPPFDAKVLLNITPNRDHGDRFTCMGTTLRGRRCRNPRKESIADDTLGQLPGICHDHDLLENTLDKLVFDVYCHLHRGQAPKSQWSQTIREEAYNHRPSQRSIRRSIPVGALNQSRIARTASVNPCSSSHPQAASPPQETSPQRESMNQSQDSETNQPEETSDEEPCPICYRSFSEAGQVCETSCGHKFCFECIRTWLGNSRTCPLDRRPLGRSAVKLVSVSSPLAVEAVIATCVCG